MILLVGCSGFKESVINNFNKNGINVYFVKRQGHEYWFGAKSYIGTMNAQGESTYKIKLAEFELDDDNIYIERFFSITIPIDPYATPQLKGSTTVHTIEDAVKWIKAQDRLFDQEFRQSIQ